MDPINQRIKIAEACGWTFITQGDCPYGLPPNDKTALRESVLPDYLNDLNAMHEAEDRITDSKARAEYAEELVTILNRDHHGEYRFVGASSFLILHATASQRAEAFLKVLGLWEENAYVEPAATPQQRNETGA